MLSLTWGSAWTSAREHVVSNVSVTPALRPLEVRLAFAFSKSATHSVCPAIAAICIAVILVKGLLTGACSDKQSWKQTLSDLKSAYKGSHVVDEAIQVAVEKGFLVTGCQHLLGGLLDRGLCSSGATRGAVCSFAAELTL